MPVVLTGDLFAAASSLPDKPYERRSKKLIEPFEQPATTALPSGKKLTQVGSAPEASESKVCVTFPVRTSQMRTVPSSEHDATDWAFAAWCSGAVAIPQTSLV